MRHKNPYLKLYIALILILLIFGVGIVGFMWIEGYGFLDALYMTVITVSTVGYGIVNQGEFSTNGKILSIALIIGSAGTFVFAITTLTTFIVEGELRVLIEKYRFKKKIKKMENHIVICGMGRTGRECAAELNRQGKSFVCIDKNAEIINNMKELYGEQMLGIVGNATWDEVLLQANLPTAAGLISALPNDAENVYITLTARGLCPKIEIISRAEHEYSSSKLVRAGANHVILPNYIGGKRMVNLITRPGLVEFIELITGETDTDVHIESFDCIAHPILWNKSIAELQIRSRTGLIVVGRKRADVNIDLNPGPQLILQKEDRIFLMGSKENFKKWADFILKTE